MNSNLIRAIIILLSPIAFIVHIGYGMYIGILSAIDEIRAGLKYPQDTKFGNKDNRDG